MLVHCTVRPVHRPVQHSERRPCISQQTYAGAQVSLELASRFTASSLPSHRDIHRLATPVIGCFGPPTLNWTRSLGLSWLLTTDLRPSSPEAYRYLEVWSANFKAQLKFLAMNSMSWLGAAGWRWPQVVLRRRPPEAEEQSSPPIGQRQRKCLFLF